jgi:chaperonin cofactor prefoldin
MSSRAKPSQIRDLQYSIKENFEEMKSRVDKIGTVHERTEEELGSLKNRLDQAEVSPFRHNLPCALLSSIQYAAISLNKLEGDIETRFASLSSSISDYQERIDGAMREWQGDFGSSTSFP